MATTLALTVFWLLGQPPHRGSAWAFEGVRAEVMVRGEAVDSLTQLTVQQLQLPLQGAVSLRVSARANSVGGVTLRLEDFQHEDQYCELYADRPPTGRLEFSGGRCTFSAFTGRMTTQATCRKISGSAERLPDGRLFLKAHSPDCTAQPLGLPLQIAATVSPR